MTRFLRSLALATALSGWTALPADAQPAKFAGSWTFKAWIGGGCEFTGLARISPVPEEDGTHVCELTAHQACGTLEWTVRQSCTAIPHGSNRLSIRSQIVEFLGADATDSYLPDNFLLTIDSARRMFGALHSYDVYKAEWIRDEGVTS